MNLACKMKSAWYSKKMQTLDHGLCPAKPVITTLIIFCNATIKASGIVVQKTLDRLLDWKGWRYEGKRYVMESGSFLHFFILADTRMPDISTGNTSRKNTKA
jgi:hypothetical protein